MSGLLLTLIFPPWSTTICFTIAIPIQTFPADNTSYIFCHIIQNFKLTGSQFNFFPPFVTRQPCVSIVKAPIFTDSFCIGVFLYSALRNCAFYPVCYFSGAERFCHIIVTANCQASQFIQFIIFWRQEQNRTVGKLSDLFTYFIPINSQSDGIACSVWIVLFLSSFDYI